MAWTMTGVRDAMKTRLDAIGIVVYDTMPEQPMVPCATIAPAIENPVTYDDSMGGDDATLRLVVTVLVQRIVAAVAQDAVDGYLAPSGSSSVRGALNSFKVASGWDSLTVKGAQHYGQFEFGTGESSLKYLGAEFAVEVLVS